MLKLWLASYGKVKPCLLVRGETPLNPPETEKEAFMEKRSVILATKLTQQEADEIRKRAEREGITISDYLRAVALNKQIRSKKRDCKELSRVAYELNKIGTNINQIARYVNASREIDIKVLEKLSNVEDRLTEILKEILSLKAETQQLANEE